MWRGQIEAGTFRNGCSGWSGGKAALGAAGRRGRGIGEGGKVVAVGRRRRGRAESEKGGCGCLAGKDG